MNKAVLFIIFNRLSTTKRVFNEIRKAKPPRLYIASDGPRNTIQGEDKIIEKIRKYIIDNINWDCEVKTLFRKKNRGCGLSVSEAITWFFKNENDGIILEDDCLPNQSFFYFCETLLDKYKNNKLIWHISGDQFIPDYESKYSYYFAKIQHCWGWASWADRWNNYSYDLTNYSEINLKKFSNNTNVQKYWEYILHKMKNNEIDTWDYQWLFKIVEMNGLCINPSKNMITNIGFGTHATHTMNKNDPNSKLKSCSISKIIYTPEIKLDIRATNLIYSLHFGIDTRNNINMIVEKFINVPKNIKKNIHIILYKFFENINKSEETIIFEKYKHKTRYVKEKVLFRNRMILMPDVVSFAYQIKEIFVNEIYKFKSDNLKPIIYDCGSNIGLSVLYFKEVYPNAIIKAFEPDSNIFLLLRQNLKGLKKIQYYNKAVWVNNKNLTFNSDGADGGSLLGSSKNKVVVKAIRLKNLLEKENNIDFLKIDIEGAEIEVIKDCQRSLDKVQNIFIEYHSFINMKQSLQIILEILTKNGFRYYLDTINKPIHPYLDIDGESSMDLQVNIFGKKNE